MCQLELVTVAKYTTFVSADGEANRHIGIKAQRHRAILNFRFLIIIDLSTDFLSVFIVVSSLDFTYNIVRKLQI